MISDKFMKILKDNEIQVEIVESGKEIELEWFTNLGEDFIVTLNCKDDESFLTEFIEYYMNFDPEEHAEMWINIRGTRGVPNSIRALIDDADNIDEFMDKIVHELSKEYANERKIEYC